MNYNIKKETWIDHFGLKYYTCLNNHTKGKRKMKKEAQKNFRRILKEKLKNFEE